MKNRKTFRLLISLIIILVLGMLACSLLSINNISTDFVESGESRIFQTKSNKAGDNNNSAEFTSKSKDCLERVATIQMMNSTMAILESKKHIMFDSTYKTSNIQKAMTYLLNSYKPSASLIPKIIHQQYKSKKLTFEQAENVASFKRENGFLHLLWTDDELDVFVQEFHPNLTKLFQGFKLPVLRADLARYLLLRTFGGYYSDIDTVNLKSLDSWTGGKDRIIGFIAGIEVDTDRVDWKDWYPRSLQFCQWTIVSSPGNPVIVEVIERVLEQLARVDPDSITAKDVVHLTGPAPFTDAVVDKLGKFKIQVHELRNIEEPKLFHDILVMPITAFSPGVGHMGSKSIYDKNALVNHLFAGEWKG